MATGPLSVFRHLRRAALQDGGMTDGQLLESFLNQRDESAFEALVYRHGPMVLGVCRRVLSNIHDAEDAFQATFLIFVRKATAIRKRESVASWLHRTAFRAALEANSVRRRSRERQVSTMPEPEAPVAGDVWNDLRPLIDQELDRLADKYREAVVLCDLEGKTRKEAAQQLGVPEGTLSGRLTTARRMLAGRLAGRGLTVSDETWAATMSGTAAANVPKSLLLSTSKVTTSAVISANVTALTEGVMKTMLPSKLKIAAVIFLTAVLVASAVFHVARDVQGDDKPSPDKDSPRAQVDQPKAAPAWKEVASFGEHKKSVDVLAIGSDLVATSGPEGVVRIWDLRKQKMLRTYSSSRKNLPVHALSFSPDGKYVTSVAEGGAIFVTAVSDTDNRGRGIPPCNVEFRALGPDHKTLLVPGGSEFALWEVDVLDARKSLTDQLDVGFRDIFKGHKDDVTALAVARHDGSFASGSKDKTVIVWDRKKKTARFTGEGHTDSITNLSFEDKGKYLASSSKDGTARLWDLSKKKQHHVLKGHDGAVLAVAFSHDGKLLATAGKDKVIRIWDVNTARMVMTLKGHTDAVKCLAFSRDGKYLASGGADNTVKVWEVKQ
jgi:RNA polymerase sigma factor (sigma-70 family)